MIDALVRQKKGSEAPAQLLITK